MNGYIDNIEALARQNTDFRRVVYTAKHSQLVLMSLLPNEEIGLEIHTGDQFLRFESGQGKALLNSVEHELIDGVAVVVPAGVEHNIINTSSTEPLKLYSIYSPPHHRDQVVHRTKQEAEDDHEEFDGRTTEA